MDLSLIIQWVAKSILDLHKPRARRIKKEDSPIRSDTVSHNPTHRHPQISWSINHMGNRAAEWVEEENVADERVASSTVAKYILSLNREYQYALSHTPRVQ